MQRFIPIFLCFLLAGCATGRWVDRNFAKVNPDDGITAKEAKYIAQKQLYTTKHRDDYKYEFPLLVSPERIIAYPEYWFIVFDPHHYDKSFWTYLVVVDSRSGKVKFAEPYKSTQHQDFDFVFK